MNTTTIGQVLSMPDKSALDCVSGTITEVYKIRNVNGKNVQDAKLKDGTGEIKLTVWDHPDISMYRGQDVIIQTGPKGGLTVKYDGYQNRNVNTISMSKFCTFQKLQVHQAQTGGAVAAQPNHAPSGSAGGCSGGAANNPSGPVPIVVNGAKVGMALNNACQFLVAAGETFNVERVHSIASEIIRLSTKMENGEFAPAKEDVPY